MAYTFTLPISTLFFCIGKMFILSRNIIQRNEIFIKWLSIVEDNNFLASNTVQTERVN